MRPKSEIYTPKRDDEHPHHFHMRHFVFAAVAVVDAKGRTIRKLKGGRGKGEVQKKYSRKGKLDEKKFMHAIWP